MRAELKRGDLVTARGDPIEGVVASIYADGAPGEIIVPDFSVGRRGLWRVEPSGVEPPGKWVIEPKSVNPKASRQAAA